MRWTLAAIAFASNSAYASTDRLVRLEVERPVELSSCVDVTALREAVTRRIGRDPFREDAPDRMIVSLARDTEKLSARIEQVGPSAAGKRDIEAPASDCSGLSDTLALSIAIAIDPMAFVAPVPVPVVEPVKAVVVARVEPRPVIVVRGSAGLVGSLGAAPGATIGAAAQLSVRRGRWSLGLEGRLDRAGSATSGIGEVKAAMRFGVLVGCLEQWAAVCAVAGLGGLRGEGEGFGIDRRDWTWLGVLGARGAIRLKAGPVRVVPHADVLVPTHVTELQIDGRTVWRSPRVQAAVGVVGEVDLW